MPSRHVRSKNPDIGGGGGSVTVVEAFSDAFILNIKADETANAVPTDQEAFAMALGYNETNDVQSETLQLAFPSPDFGDSNVAPDETKLFMLRVWMSATTMQSSNGVTNPGNADGVNNGTVATYQSVALGATNPNTRSTLGTNVPTGISITGAIMRVWYKSVCPTAGNKGEMFLTALTGTFPSRLVFSHTTVGTVDKLDGSFTYDLIASGVDTLTKIRDIRVDIGTTDFLAGVTPHVLTIDAACVEISGAFT